MRVESSGKSLERYDATRRDEKKEKKKVKKKKKIKRDIGRPGDHRSDFRRSIVTLLQLTVRTGGARVTTRQWRNRDGFIRVGGG